MHGQPLCLSKTLQQLPARDKSNHSQPTPPFPPPTHKHTPIHFSPLCLSITHTLETHTHTFTCTSASLQVSTKMERFRAAFVTSQRSSLQIILFLCLFLWRQNTAGLNIGWGGEVWGESPFFFHLWQRAITWRSAGSNTGFSTELWMTLIKQSTTSTSESYNSFFFLLAVLWWFLHIKERFLNSWKSLSHNDSRMFKLRSCPVIPVPCVS